MVIRFVINLLALLLTTVNVFAADEPKAKPVTSSAEEADGEKTALSEEIIEISKEYAEKIGKHQQAIHRFNNYQTEIKKKLLELAKDNPKDPGALDAVLLLVEKIRAPLSDEMLELVQMNQLQNPKVGKLCLQLSYPKSQMKGQEDFLKHVSEKHAEEKVRGLATCALAEYYRRMAQAMDKKADETEQAQYLGNAERCLMKIKNATDIFSEAYNKTTIGEKIENELARIHNMPNLKIGKIAPEINSTDIDGQPLKLSDSHGKVTVLVFWGSWCGPYMGLVPHEKELVERMRGKPFAMVSVNCGDSRDRAQDTRKVKEMTWPCWWDGGTTDGLIQATYNVPHYPRIFVIDAKGVIRNIDVRHKELDKAIDKLLEEIELNKMARR